MSLLLLLPLLLSLTTAAAAQQLDNSNTSSLALDYFSVTESPWLPSQNRTLLSPNSVFAAGFRRLPTLRTTPSLQHYSFSIWFHNSSASPVVWYATNSPLPVSASLSINAACDLRLLITSDSDEIEDNNLWPSPASSSDSGQPANTTRRLVLRDDGNLVCGESWASFDHPRDTLLPNQSTSNGTELVSRNGKYRLVDSQKLVFNLNGSSSSAEAYWNFPNARRLLMLDATGQLRLENGDLRYSADFNASRFRRLTLDDDGNLRIYTLDPNNSSHWMAVWRAVVEPCTIFGKCGPNFICDASNSDSDPDSDSPPPCVCAPGFTRVGGACSRRNSPITSAGNIEFIRLDYVKFGGDSGHTTPVRAVNLTDCQRKCRADPRCLGFGFQYNGSGPCELHLEGRLLYGYWSPATHTVTFLRVDGSESLGSNHFTGMGMSRTACPVRVSLPPPPDPSNTTTRNISIICALFAAELIVGTLFLRAFLRKYVRYVDMARTLGLELLPTGGPRRFTYAELKTATNDFSTLVGSGGFGDVFRGELPDRRVIAVKCLKNTTALCGGDGQFWAEVTIIARMHHLNLVRLWGFCAEKGRRILVYEYVPNGSLDKLLFRPVRVGSESAAAEAEPTLDWSIRYRIAVGSARAIAYLHDECRDREWVLHCDIKPENILLGDDFCPKISDFGLAKLQKREDMVTMSRIRGTRGYMAPEWVRSERITPKADVYSFGMVLLEIVSGWRNFVMPESAAVLASEEWYFPAWAHTKAFGEGRVEEILDRQIRRCYDNRAHLETIDRTVKTAMWCLQDQPEKRPSMWTVAKMLQGTVEITEPPKPTIFFLSD